MRYVVMIKGSNVILKRMSRFGRPPAACRCLTTRVVCAADEDAAVKLAIDSATSELDGLLDSTARKRLDKKPELEVVELRTADEGEPIDMAGRGFLFF